MGKDVPGKLYFRIGEVSRQLSLKPSVLRFWETEFPAIRPQKSRSGQRLYSRDDIALLGEIKNLLYNDKLTIEGARKRLGSKRDRASHQNTEALLEILKKELRSLHELLS